MEKLMYYHVDVFSGKPLSGNGLSVILGDTSVRSERMLSIAQEFKQFETIFLHPKEGRSDIIETRVFTVEEELEFAGHPILGAAAVMHDRYFKENATQKLQFQLVNKEVETTSTQKGNIYQVQMNQGIPEYLGSIPENTLEEVLKALCLKKENLAAGYPIEVITTGLPYLLIPITSGLEHAQIITNDFEELLQSVQAKFVYVFDVNTMEARTWDNFGKVEDVATGSAAGPLCAYLVRNRYLSSGECVEIHQGAYVNRPSVIKAWMDADWEQAGNVYIEGEVTFVVKGGTME